MESTPKALIKSRIRTYQRRNPSGGISTVQEHTDRRQKKIMMPTRRRPDAQQQQAIQTSELPTDLRIKVQRGKPGTGGEIKLSKLEVATLLKKGKVGFVSAGKNPTAKADAKLTDKQVGERSEKLRKELVTKGLKFARVKGKYGEEEDAFMVMVPEMERDELVQIGKKFNQDSVIYSDHNQNELIYTTGKNAGKRHRGTGFTYVDKKAVDFYSEIKTAKGTVRFSLNFNFDKLQKSKAGSVKPGHKYLSRTGSPGHYEYKYLEMTGGDLFGGIATKATGDQESEVARVPVTAIHRDPTQPREHFDEMKLKELGASIKKIGLVQALSIRPHPDAKGEFMIIAGERRWRAMTLAGVEVAKVEIFHTTDEKVIAAIQVAENVGREQMNPIEEARAYQKMIDTGSSPQQVAEAVGSSILTVERRLSFLKLIPALQEMIKHGSLTISRAEIIATGNLRPQFQQNIIKRLNMGKVSREALRGMVGRYQTAQTQTGLFASEGNSLDQRVHKTRRVSLERDLARLLDDFGDVLARIGEGGGAKIVPALAKEKGKLAVTARKVALINEELKKLDREMQFAVKYFEGGGTIDGYLNAKGIKGKRKRRKLKKALLTALLKSENITVFEDGSRWFRIAGTGDPAKDWRQIDAPGGICPMKTRTIIGTKI